MQINLFAALEQAAEKVSQGGFPIVLGLPFDFALGLFFAACAKERVRRDGVFSKTPLALVCAHATLALLPRALYLCLAHPAWSVLYLWDPSRLPPLVMVPLVLLDAALLLAGYLQGARLIRNGKTSWAWGIVAGVAFFLALLGYFLRHRIVHYGSHAQFHSGHALPLGDVKLGYVLVAIAVGVVVHVGVVGWELQRDAKRVAEV
ncbi:MAG: hypothetical protein HY698_10475 [Deltaproteobacteria bacterium]|nr:hypothetical protein [Deltaproteobacteria bacterium]